MVEILQNLWNGIFYAISFTNILGVLFGYAVGVLSGTIPGIMGVTGLALMLPFTFGLPPMLAISMMMGCYKGACYAGSITATLFNIPGTPEAAATVLESYPMTQKGEQQRALELALWASVIGGTVSNILLIFTAPPLAKLAVRVGPAETAALILFSLTAVIGLMGTTRLAIAKGFLSVVFGLMIAMIGLDPMESTRRYAFGLTELDNGIPFVVAVISFLAFTEILEKVMSMNSLAGQQSTTQTRYTYTMRQRIDDLKFCFKDLVRSSFVGSFLGAMPGIGAAPVAFVCYGEAKRTAKDKSMFGKGDARGIAAAESGNNAVAASSIIPLITLGIPGSVAAAILGGAFMVQGMIPGPMLMQDHPHVIYGLFVLFIITDILGAFIVALPFIALVRKLFYNINYHILFPLVLVFCAIGVYTEEYDLFTIYLLVILGAIGFVLDKLGFSVSALVLALILGPVLERETRTALLMSNGSPMIFFESPVACTLIVLSVALFAWSMYQKVKAEKEGTQNVLFETH